VDRLPLLDSNGKQIAIKTRLPDFYISATIYIDLEAWRLRFIKIYISLTRNCQIYIDLKQFLQKKKSSTWITAGLLVKQSRSDQKIISNENQKRE
jgi:hypothetical protein